MTLSHLEEVSDYKYIIMRSVFDKVSILTFLSLYLLTDCVFAPSLRVCWGRWSEFSEAVRSPVLLSEPIKNEKCTHKVWGGGDLCAGLTINQSVIRYP